MLHCRVCNSTDLSLVLDLGEQPIAGRFLKRKECGMEPHYPLRLVYCQGCETAQLDYTVPKEKLFLHHTYLSGTTDTLKNHWRELLKIVKERFGGRTLLDIGSNDGTFLHLARSAGYEVTGVEPNREVSDLSFIPRPFFPTPRPDAGVIKRFYNLSCAKELGRGAYDVIHASGVLFHVEEIHSVLEGIRYNLAPGGGLIAEFLAMEDIVKNVAWDQIYHEHLLYYTLWDFVCLMERHGLRAIATEHSPIHGGSWLVYMRKSEEVPSPSYSFSRLPFSAYVTFGQVAKYRQNADRFEIYRWKSQGKRIVGLGAPVKGNTRLNALKLTTDEIDCLEERNKLRRGLYAPGSHIPILMEDEAQEPPDVYYVLAWNFKEEIERRYAHLKDRVEFYYPVSST